MMQELREGLSLLVSSVVSHEHRLNQLENAATEPHPTVAQAKDGGELRSILTEEFSALRRLLDAMAPVEAGNGEVAPPAPEVAPESQDIDNLPVGAPGPDTPAAPAAV